MADKPLFISGRGLICAAGNNCSEFWLNLQKEKSFLTELTLFPSPRCGHFPVGQVNADIAAMCGHKSQYRSEQLALIAVKEALREAGLTAADLEKAAIVSGACTGGMRTSEELIDSAVNGDIPDYQMFRGHECASTTRLLAREYGLKGPQLTLSTACTSGALAIAAAADLIKSGQAEVVICGGVDSLTRLTLNGFASLLVVSPEGPQPFDQNRHGMSLGEGAAYIVLESAAHLQARKGRALAALSGYGVSCDAYHASTPDPEAKGATAAMREALGMANLDAGQIGYINAHGTGTKDNDRTEALAISQVFATVPPVSSTKRYYGHPLAASGAIEAILATLVLEKQWLPPNLGLNELDQDVHFQPLTTGRPAALDHVMSNSFGFGGNNTVLIFSSVPPKPLAIEVEADFSAGLAVLAAADLWPAAAATPYKFPEWLPQVEIAAHQIENAPWKELLPAAKLRRLGKVQTVALSTAQAALNQYAMTDPAAAVLVATALGEHSETAAFVENMARHREETPMPAKFINSVHNSLAGQLAIWHKLTGANHTFTHNRLSLAAALWQAEVLIKRGRAKEALVVTADTLSPYGLLAGRELGWLKAEKPAGEGAAAFILGAPVSGRPRLTPHWQFDKNLLTGADLLLVPSAADIPADLPADLPIATWEDQCGYFCTSDGLALCGALQTVSQNKLFFKFNQIYGNMCMFKNVVLYQHLEQQVFLFKIEMEKK